MILLGLNVETMDLFDVADMVYALWADGGAELDEALAALEKAFGKPPWPDSDTWGMDTGAQESQAAMMELGQRIAPRE